MTRAEARLLILKALMDGADLDALEAVYMDTALTAGVAIWPGRAEPTWHEETLCVLNEIAVMKKERLC